MRNCLHHGCEATWSNHVKSLPAAGVWHLKPHSSKEMQREQIIPCRVHHQDNAASQHMPNFFSVQPSQLRTHRVSPTCWLELAEWIQPAALNSWRVSRVNSLQLGRHLRNGHGSHLFHDHLLLHQQFGERPGEVRPKLRGLGENAVSQSRVDHPVGSAWLKPPIKHISATDAKMRYFNGRLIQWERKSDFKRLHYLHWLDRPSTRLQARSFAQAMAALCSFWNQSVYILTRAGLKHLLELFCSHSRSIHLRCYLLKVTVSYCMHHATSRAILVVRCCKKCPGLGPGHPSAWLKRVISVQSVTSAHPKVPHAKGLSHNALDAQLLRLNWSTRTVSLLISVSFNIQPGPRLHDHFGRFFCMLLGLLLHPPQSFLHIPSWPCGT